MTRAERPDLGRGIYDVAVEAYADMPGGETEEMEAYEDWLAHDMQGSGDLPEATFVALAGHDIVGYAKFSMTDAQPTAAFHDTTGVKRAWRGRGIAGALKRAQVAWAKQRGYWRLITTNEMRNEPIRRLNDSLGYRKTPGACWFDARWSMPDRDGAELPPNATGDRRRRLRQRPRADWIAGAEEGWHRRTGRPMSWSGCCGGIPGDE